MPFDVGIETAEMRRTRLVDALRNGLPKNFKWDFRTLYEEKPCGTIGCALGVASILWPDHKKDIRRDNNDQFIAEFFGITKVDANRIFWDQGPRYGAFYRYDTPRATTIANALEKAGNKAG